jgi:hypothetical protein
MIFIDKLDVSISISSNIAEIWENTDKEFIYFFYMLQSLRWEVRFNYI